MEDYENLTTHRHLIGYRAGMLVRRWLVRGYSWGTFRNGFAAGLGDHHANNNRKRY